MSLRMRRKARKETKRVRKPRESVLVLKVEGNFGNASNRVRFSGITASSLSMTVSGSS